MSELHDLLERRAAEYDPPSDLLVRVRERRLQRQRNRRLASAVVGVLITAVAIGGVFRVLQRPDTVFVDPPPNPVVGTWESIDTDGSSQTMDITYMDGVGYEVVIDDDGASVCDGAPSTMTGTGQLDDVGLVIEAPVLECDDGSTPVPLDGSSLEEAVRNYTLVHDAATDTIADNFGVEWRRPGATPEAGNTEPEAPTAVMWPQSSLEEAREAQTRADAGDPAYSWQVDRALDNGDRPSDAAIFARFLTEELGWDGFRCCEERSFGESMYWTGDGTRVVEADFIRCARGESNALYPEDPNGRTCAPTLDDGGYERVRVAAQQPVDGSPEGIWVIQSSQPQPPFHQVDPLTAAEIAQAVESYLQTRVDGKRAGDYGPAGIPLLYATSDGARYERFDYEVVDGPNWPFGDVDLNVRLFADGGQTVVEQPFSVELDFSSVVTPAPSVRLTMLSYDLRERPTTENGAPVPEPYDVLDGRVTFSADWSWEETFIGPHGPDATGLYRGNEHDQVFAVVADPLTPTATCDVGDQAPSADAFVRSVQSTPNLSVSAPRPARVGSIDAVQLDVTAGDESGGCVVLPGAQEQPYEGPAVLAPRPDKNHPEERLWWGVGRDDRARLYVFDLPGSPARTIAILVMAPKSDFEAVLETAQPIIDSVEFPTD